MLLGLMVLLVALVVYAQTTTKSFTVTENNNLKNYVQGKYGLKDVVVTSYAEEHGYVVTQLTIGGIKYRLFQSQQFFNNVKGGVEVGK